MKQLKIYKRNGYEFQVVEQSGDVARAIGRKGKSVLHEVTMTDESWSSRWSYSGEDQAKDKFKELIE